MSEPLARHLGFLNGPRSDRRHRLPDLRAAAFCCLCAIAAWFSRYRQRRVLAELSDHLLDDVGISRGEALREAAKPFWR